MHSRRQHASAKVVSLCLLFIACGAANAHTSEQGFVLLLPTDAYTFFGVTVVVLTIMATVLLPDAVIQRLFTPITLSTEHFPTLPKPLLLITSWLSFFVLVTLLWIGYTGTHDPLRNLLPLSIWTIWWIGIVCLQGVFGYFWRLINPWSGPFALLIRAEPSARLPTYVGCWPGVILFLLFSVFALADTAPEDPPRLAAIITGYWLFTIGCLVWFGIDEWFKRGEFVAMLMLRLAQLAPVGLHQRKLAVGLPGWRLTTVSGSTNSTVSGAVFSLALLASGSFDGLNETFWWLTRLGINPLEFPGRSAVIAPTIAGLLLAVAALTASYAVCIKVGVRMANARVQHPVRFSGAFAQLSVAILPIALAYHFAHFLMAFMVNIQYTVAATTDPLQNGRDILGLGQFYVTTSFFNTQSSVRQIWLTQAAAVVIGHVLSLLLAHRIALQLWRNPRAATLSQLPLAFFMVLYTLLGLWLLAAPRGA